ncbi:hypothetical protein D0867_16503 [Hortaea werneckii]|uniref:Uncharacterized protein n=1 Tax=Hortaea werneckii TaxID=91943 RepID=A0A3M6WLG7_HORWE|nr:hypothetical protein D0867_16503 [Hortaea werneckii]
MASSTFRDSMNSLGWSRREQPANTNKQNPLLGSLQKYNPFGGEGNVRLPTAEGEAPGAPLPARSRREEEEGWFARKSRSFCFTTRLIKTLGRWPYSLFTYTTPANATATLRLLVGELVGPILALG